jgi:hypothetical protein
LEEERAASDRLVVEGKRMLDNRRSAAIREEATRMTTATEDIEGQVHELHTRLEHDVRFKEGIDRDPGAALREAGLGALVDAAERERDRLTRLAARYGEDEAFRASVDRDPLGTLTAKGVPPFAAEHVLRRAGASPEVVERASADVEAHLSQRELLTWTILVVALATALLVGEAALFSDAASAPRCRGC